MEKTIQRYGNSLIIRFDSQDIDFYKLKEGQRYDIEISLIKNKK